MERALSLTERSLGSASPNPSVGAVVVKDGIVVGEGFTQPQGKAHAEIMALQQAGPKSLGAHLYTTLEPCNHFGKTPPCTQAIIDAGITKVHAALIDPNPLVNGRGLSQLRESGVETQVGEGEQRAEELMEAYVKFITTGLPFVTAKYAMSLDGKIATRTGDSQWITGKASRRYVHQLRTSSDAIMVGINTVLTDNPKLTARDEQGNPLSRQPMRVIVDSHGSLSHRSRLLSEPGHTLVAVADADNAVRHKLTQAHAEVYSSPTDGGSVDLKDLIKVLGQRDITSILVEGGASLLGSLFDNGLVDKVIAFIAPSILGGKTALSPVGGIGIESLSDVKHLNRVKISQFENDIAIIGYCEARSDVHRNH